MPKPRSGETHDDFMSRCMSDAEAMRDFPTREQRAAFCTNVSRQAASQQVLQMAVVQSSAAARTDSMMGKEFLVVPAVLVQGQVLRNNLGTCFLSGDDITDDWAARWNHIPVIVHAHPTVRGVAVSARAPEILKAYGVGFVFGAHVARNGSVKLKGEVWLDLARAAEVEELAVILDRIRKGQTVELSTGFAATVEDVAGVHNGATYEKVIHPQDADHLAIFAEAVGACSLSDGCGLGVNEALPAEIVGGEPPLPVNPAEGDHEEGHHMEPAANQEKVLHIVDRLLALVGLSAPAKAPAPAAPTTVAGMLECLDAVSAVANAAVTHPLLQRLVGLGLTPCQARVATGWARAWNADYPESDEELRMHLHMTLQKLYGGGPERGVWIEAVYQASTEVVFSVVQDKVVGGRTEQCFRSTYSMQDAGQITFTAPVEVKRRVIFEVVPSMPSTPTAVQQEEAKMTEQEKKDADAAAAAAAPAAAPVAAVQAAAPAAPATPAPAAAPSADVLALQQKLDAQAQEIATLKGIVAPAVAEQERSRTALIAELAANEAVPFDEAELKTKPLAELEKLQLMAKPGSFAGRGGPRIATQAATDEAQYAEPVPYFGKKADEKEGK